MAKGMGAAAAKATLRLAAAHGWTNQTGVKGHTHLGRFAAVFAKVVCRMMIGGCVDASAKVISCSGASAARASSSLPSELWRNMCGCAVLTLNR